jgi:maleate isomerase
MPDVLGYRAKMGVLVPSTNTIMEPELYAMAPPGVTFHSSRMYVPARSIASEADAQAFLLEQRAALQVALRDALTLEPDHLLLGITAMSFLDGVEGHQRFKQGLVELAKQDITTAAEAAVAALRALGARRLGLLSPHPAMMDAHYQRFFAESDFEVVKLHAIRCPTTLAIAQVDEAALRAALVELNGPDVDAIVQVGADLAMVRLADEAERWLGKPVIAINAAILWHALLSCAIRDQVRGFGMLLREY